MSISSKIMVNPQCSKYHFNYCLMLYLILLKLYPSANCLQSYAFINITQACSSPDDEGTRKYTQVTINSVWKLWARPLSNTHKGGNCSVWNTEIPHRPSSWIFVTHLVLHPILSLKDLSVGVIERKKSLQQLHNMILLEYLILILLP